ncbi:putative zinc finger protein [Teratosphaeria nubilosa]|uniref:Putative zinc finger protein n=1 Tax=Teratosphaeria nubilosa TaxID=161662 RepID=A0A6G1L708_9PEZI|nr:putative zinc finger protein [Teratosphaeria nubilosa]
MTSDDHWAPRYPCHNSDCHRIFPSQVAVTSHMNATEYWPHYCRPCKRSFDNANNLHMHLNSRTHRGANVPCPWCKTGFTSASGLFHYLETGSCPKATNVNRDTILKFIRQKDPGHTITKKLLSYDGDTTTTYSASNQALNGNYWECYLCHRQFNAKQAPNQHLNSPAHEQKVYHCPQGGCSKEFGALAQLFNHLESETRGFMRFEKVRHNVGNVLSSGRMIAF